MEIEKLLSKIKQLNIEQKKSLIKREKKGEFFNIFSLLEAERDEVHTHSAFLAELLNPEGLHGKKDNLLKLFIEEILLKTIPDRIIPNTNSVVVKIEESIGEIDIANESGGRIDILIEFLNSKYAIIIENKIDANDEEKQLSRYYNYALKNYNNFTIFYLTLDGHEPPEWSTGKETEIHYWACISYKKHIKKWLEKDLKYNKDNFLVNGTIKQYITLINKLTGQEINGKMNKIVDLMLENSNEIVNIWENLDKWKYKLFSKNMEEVAINTNCTFKPEKPDSPWIWDGGNYVQFVSKEYKKSSIWFGKFNKDKPFYWLEKKSKEPVTQLLCLHKNDSPIDHPYGYNYLDDKYTVFNIEVAKSLCNGEFQKYMVECIERILKDPYFPR